MDRIEKFLIDYNQYLNEMKNINPKGVYFISPPVDVTQKNHHD